MRRVTFRLTFPAIMAAITVLILTVGGLLPSGQLGIAAACALFGVAAVIETGIWGGVGVYVSASVLGLLLAGDKTTALFYAVFFGYYPVLKLLAERIPGRVWEWVVKLAVVNGIAAVLLLFFSNTIVDLDAIHLSKPMAFLAVNVVFVVYDLCVSGLTVWYGRVISKRIRRGR